MKKMLFTIVACLMLTADIVNAQTLHLINFCNTIDTSIGTNEDYDRTINEASNIASLIGYNIKYYKGKGENCSNEHLMNVLNSLRCDKDDIVIFYYSGHGTRSKFDKSEFPQMCLKYNGYQQDKFVAVHTVVEKLQEKGARFSLVITDCCNNKVRGITAKSLLESKSAPVDVSDETTMAEIANYKKLFLENKGMVIATSSKQGQTSGGDTNIGGVFSFAFWDIAMQKAVGGDIPATWQSVMQMAGQCTYLITGLQQEPYYEVATMAASAPIPTASQQGITAEDQVFAKDLSSLLNKSRTVEWRLEQAAKLADKYFSASAKVATVARNGSTIVDYEDALAFLRRIASSTFIQQVNIINETTDSQGKYQFIKVQEIRNKKQL